MPSRKLSTPARRRDMREKLWPKAGERIYPREKHGNEKEKGWFSAPRTLPLILMLLNEDVRLSKNMDLTRTYIGLLADNYGEGIIEIDDEQHYALVSGLKGARGVRSWRERVKQLGEVGLIEVRQGIGGRIGFVLIVHPDIAVQKLYDQGLVPDDWWAEYSALWLNVQGEPTTEDGPPDAKAAEKPATATVVTAVGRA